MLIPVVAGFHRFDWLDIVRFFQQLQSNEQNIIGKKGGTGKHCFREDMRSATKRYRNVFSQYVTLLLFLKY